MLVPCVPAGLLQPGMMGLCCSGMFRLVFQGKKAFQLRNPFKLPYNVYDKTNSTVLSGKKHTLLLYHMTTEHCTYTVHGMYFTWSMRL